ncbi:hypothetical protein L2755_19905 [Shewanella abyssi]|uniref:hypothetical protein n=1 Tax=Shewanella abyssi TaxID=311789 RepID=UPI00200C4EA5|nr:hypothetical protein [Shewanella abyssi]MCL1051872.1 hypothetical protein [Shewanella abyssi]
MENENLSVVDFKRDIERVLSAMIANGHKEIWAGDLGDVIGALIVSEARNFKEVDNISDCICSGIGHGLGLSHERINTRESVEEYIARWSKKKPLVSG